MICSHQTLKQFFKSRTDFCSFRVKKLLKLLQILQIWLTDYNCHKCVAARAYSLNLVIFQLFAHTLPRTFKETILVSIFLVVLSILKVLSTPK